MKTSIEQLQKHKEYYQKHREERIASASKWNKEHSDARKKIMDRDNKKRKGLKRIWWESKSFGGKETIIGKINCDRCKKHKDLVIHHKDGDRKNNDPLNLWVICKSCHAYVHGKVRGGINTSIREGGDVL
jgi:DNA-directed RNA polymerase subunit M/transcription elongation factor TFIIS